MDNSFAPDEKLYRAVYPPEVSEMFWRRDGKVSSAAFADPKGLSVDRGNFREDKDVVPSMKKRFKGNIVCVLVKSCVDIDAVVKYLPSSHNIYHSEIHGSSDTLLLSKKQRYSLANKALVVG